MNDFTKEDLKIIIAWGIDRVEAVGIKEFIDEGSHPVYLKVDKLIENYCEHEHQDNIAGWVYKCAKCGMKFGDESQ